MLAPLRQTGKELKTLSKALAHSRRHITAVKQGRGYFHMLHQESLERKNALRAAQQAQDMRWRTTCQAPRYSSDEEFEEEISIPAVLTEDHSQGKVVKRKRRKKMTLRSFTPVYTSVLIPNPTEAKSEHLFRQLCAIHWLLEALTLESGGSMHSILTCWNPTDPGGTKKTLEEIEEEKLTTYMWELFITDTKKFTQKARHSPLSKKIYKTISSLGISQLSSQSSPHTQTPPDSTPPLVFCSEDNVNMNIASSDVTSESAQTKEEEETLCPALQRLIQITHEEVSKDFYKEEDRAKKTELQGLPLAAPKDDRVNMALAKEQESITPGEHKARRSLAVTERKDGTTTATAKEQESPKQMKKADGCHISSFIKSKSNLCADVRQKFTAVREEAASCLHDTLESLERRQEERCCQKYQALKQIKYFKKDLERMRQLGMRAEREHDEDELKWFPVLLARLPESVKNDHYVQKILKKLEKFGKNPDLRVRPDTFLKALADLQVWELCSPEIAAAVEFVRESVVQMPEEDFSEWFQTRAPPLSAQSSPF
ncbi:coiled-coil domain-containing protein 60 [Eudromia elegans]